MKIAVASSGLGHVTRGIEAWAHDLAHALHDHGENVVLCKGSGVANADFEVVIPCWERDAAKTRRAKRLTGGRFVWRLGLGSGYGIEQTTFAWGLVRLLRKRQIDILHVQDPQLAMLTQRAHRLGLIPTKTILGHGTEEPLEFQARIDYLQHLAPWHLEEAAAQGVQNPAWTAIGNFIDTETFNPDGDDLREELGLPHDAIVVLTAAAIKRTHKRIDYLLEEFGELIRRQPDLPAYLVVAGGRENDTDELVAIGNERLGDRVRFLIQFPRQRMAALYRTANAFVLCSLKEMMPIALLEATASGLPCLVNRHPVMEWMIGPGGRSINMGEAGSLAGTLADLLSNSTELDALGSSARMYSVANFSRERVVEQILEYYRFVLSGDREAPRFSEVVTVA